MKKNCNYAKFPRQLGIVCAFLGAVIFSVPALAQDEHGVGLGKGCPVATKVGDLATCTLRVTNQDDFGDNLVVTEFWDIIDPITAENPLGANIRNPAVGNLPITFVQNATCAIAAVSPAAPIGLVFPCTIQGAVGGNSNNRVRVVSQYTVPDGMTDPLADTGKVRVRDACNIQPVGCVTTEFTQEFGASVSLFEPSLSVNKTGPAAAKVGDEITYTIGFTNTTTGTGFPGYENCTGSDTVLGDLGAFEAGVNRDFEYTVQGDDPNPLLNIATITCDVVGFDNVVTNNDNHSVDLIAPSILVTKTGPDTAKVGDEITYTIGFTNTGTGTLGACSGNDPLLGGDLGAFEAGVTRDFGYTVQGGDDNPLQNTATITCDVEGFDNQASDDDSHSVALIDPSIDVTKTGPDSAKVGDEITYTIGFTNTGSGTLGACSGSDTLLGDLGAFVAGVTQDFNYTVLPGDDDPLPNTATITCDVEGFDNKASDSDSHSVDLINPSVDLAKACRPDPVSPGEDINWAITVTNNGDVDLNCLVNDAMAGYVDEAVAVAVGGSEVLNASRTVEEGDAPVISNTATVNCAIEGFDNEVSGEATADCEVTPVDEICRTPGFWGTHAGIEKKNSTNLTQMVITAAGGTLVICGEDVTNTLVPSNQSAIEAMCVPVEGTQQLQLARQLTAAALNCVISGGGANCAGTSLEANWADANAACIANAGDLSGWIGVIDAWNNNEVCHSRDIGDSDVFAGVSPLPGPAGSPKDCNKATGNDVTIFSPDP